MTHIFSVLFFCSSKSVMNLRNMSSRSSCILFTGTSERSEEAFENHNKWKLWNGNATAHWRSHSHVEIRGISNLKLLENVSKNYRKTIEKKLDDTTSSPRLPPWCFLRLRAIATSNETPKLSEFKLNDSKRAQRNDRSGSTFFYRNKSTDRRHGQSENILQQNHRQTRCWRVWWFKTNERS